jgi:Tol biopolymer transport system component
VPKLIDSLIEVSPNPVDSSGRREVAPCVINSTQMEEAPRLSPDGSSLVFISNRTGWDEVWTARSDCTQSRQLTSFNAYGLGSPRWSPDGKEIAFDRRIDGRPEIFIIKNDGTGLRRLTNSLGSTRPCWSPDGAWIYFTLFTPGPTDLDQIWRMPVTGGEMTQITVNGGVEPIISPDGKRVYYSNHHHLYQKDLPSGAEMPVPGLENIQIDRYWEISNSAIFYVPVLSSQLNDKSGIYRFDLGTRTSTLFKRLDKLPIPGMLGVSITLDERHLAIGLVNQPLGDIMMIKGWK